MHSPFKFSRSATGHCCASRYLLDLSNMIAPVLEESSCDYSNHLDINSAWLVASCASVWVKFKHEFSTCSFPALKCSFPAWNAFVSSFKSVCPQHKTHLSLAINMFVSSLICIWRWAAETISLLMMNAFAFYLEVGLKKQKTKYRN